MLDANDMITGIDVMDFTGHAARHVGQEIDAGLSHFFQREVSPQRRVVLVPLQNIAEIANAGRGER